MNFPPVSADGVAGVRACIQGRRKVGDVIVRGIDPRGVLYTTGSVGPIGR